MTIEIATNELVEITPEGKLRLHFHWGQWRAWNSIRRIVAVIAGTQGGKTSFIPPWLHREIQQRGPGDYMVVTPTFPLLELKALPEFRRYFEDILALGNYRASPARVFSFSESGQLRTFGNSGYECRTNVFFGYAAEPESLESATAKAACLDEAGQKRFKVESWEAVMRRLSIHRGRVLISTTPYNLGWLKQRIWDRWKAGDRDIEVIRFESIANPLFSREEWEDAKKRLPGWKFDMFYRALFTRPAGLIYDVFDETRHKIPRFAIPDHWPRYLGLDFGGVHTAGLFYAGEPGTNRLYLYREYRAGGRTAKEHVQHLLRGEPMIPLCVGGSKSEGQWRREFRAAGLPIRGPAVTDVEVGIDRVYGRHKADEIFVFDDLTGYLEEKLTYSRVLDENGEPTEEIEDKNEFHFCFVAGTSVTTDHGDVLIENIKSGMKVLTRNGYKRVLLAGAKRFAPTLTLTFSDGNTLTGTIDHPIWVVNRGWISFDAIRYGNIILRKENNLWWLNRKLKNLTELSTTVTRIPPGGLIANILSGQENTFTELFGNFIMALFLTAITFIIWIKILEIIMSRIWKSSLPLTISPPIIQQLPQRGLHFLINLFAPRLSDGTNQKRDGAGIANMPEDSVKAQQQNNIYVKNVANHTRAIKLAEDQISVAMHANPHGAEKQAMTILRLCALLVEKFLREINTLIANTAPVIVISVIKNKFPMEVFNLSVENVHEYYANGILVSNCDAERYIIGWLTKPKEQGKARSHSSRSLR